MVSKGLRWFKIVLCSMLLGGLWRLNECYTWMAMREISVDAAVPALEARYWDVFPSRCLSFWPLFIRKSRDVAVFLEKTNPVLVETRMVGIGSFVVGIKLLSPHVVVEWKGEMWCISKEGRMWNVAEGSLGFRDLKVPLKPLWHMPAFTVGPEVLLSEGGQLLPEGVFPSIFSTDAIDDFMTGLKDAAWFDGVEEVVLDRRAGDDLYKLRCVRGKRTFTILIQRNKYEWQELGLALEHVLGRLEKEGNDCLIDATYTDKIVVKNLSAGAGEGSSK